MTSTYAIETNSGTITSWIPLTTTGSFSPECSNAIYHQDGFDGRFIAWDPFYGQSIDTALTCLPTEVTKWWQQPSPTGTIWDLGPFSCPYAYYTATTISQGPQKTFIACCPTLYTFGAPSSAGTLGQCISVATHGDTLTFAGALSTGSPQWATTTYSLVEDVSYTIYGVQVNGYTSMPPSSTSTSTSGSTSSSADSTSSTPSSTVSNPTLVASSSIPSPSASVSGTAHSSSGLSTAAKAGIGAGCGILFICAVFFLALWIRASKRAGNAHQAMHDIPLPSYQDKSSILSPQSREVSSLADFRTTSLSPHSRSGPIELSSGDVVRNERY